MNGGRLRCLASLCFGVLVWFSCQVGLVWASDGGGLISFQSVPYNLPVPSPPVPAPPVPGPPATPTPVPEPVDPPAYFQPVYQGGGEKTVSDAGTHSLLWGIGDILTEIKRKVYNGANYIFQAWKWAKQFFENALDWVGDWFDWWADYADGVWDWVGDWFNYAHGRTLVFVEQFRSLMLQFSVFAKFVSSLVMEVWRQSVLFLKSFVPWAFWRCVALLLGCVSWTLVELAGWLPSMHLSIPVPSFLGWVSVFVPIPILLVYVEFVVLAAVLYLTVGALLRWAKLFR